MLLTWQRFKVNLHQNMIWVVKTIAGTAVMLKIKNQLSIEGLQKLPLWVATCMCLYVMKIEANAD